MKSAHTKYREVIQSSDLDREVTLTPPATAVRTSSGGYTEGDATAVTVRAKVSYGGPVEDPNMGRVVMSQMLTITVRNQGLDAFSNEWKATYDGDEYNVEGYRVLGRKTYLEIMCDLVVR